MEVEEKSAKTLMIQGTASNVGKSLIVAGLCRIFKQDGYRVAPFKSQNMALNSYITKDGLEMGRAQVVQAEAAGIEPETDMNPILLKPTGDRKSQVILQGEVFSDMNAKKYYAYKQTFAPKVRESFERLRKKYDVIVIEGAGSPAEINLRENDIVNMFIARLARAPVLLAADIDRGGVFAFLAGTLQLLTEEERGFVKGVLINKFRGDKSLLEPGLRQLEDIIHKPTLGVIPYLSLDIDDEDSLSARIGQDAPGALLDIAVLRFPHLSNFTDFTAISCIPGAGIRYIGNMRDLRKKPDMLILPGTKNTMADLLWLRENALEGAVKSLAAEGIPIFGVCGGYQMLGLSIADPYGVEQGGEMPGIGLLPVETIFERSKTRTRVSGAFSALTGPLSGLSGAAIEGYEIHMGVTSSVRPLPSLTSVENSITGEASDGGVFMENVYGCYLHGLFDASARVLMETLCALKGVSPQAETVELFTDYKERQYDLLAESLRTHLDMNAVYSILDRGIG
ncbi:MAG: cobyric acid synthase [Spirochaetaceae bacterium]|jgi:adenosylcobyric acid synthase|nr:cobyric acid synthase [Spirochaetaceae bacterium]